MKKWICVALFVVIESQCYFACNSCSAQNAAYSCNSCLTPFHLYAFSCDSALTAEVTFIVLTALVTAAYLFLVGTGFGIYRDLFEGLQLITLVSWRSGFLGVAGPLQATNFALIQSNNFPSNFGYQFIAVMAILTLFWVLLFCVEKIPHSPTATLIRRKKYILPTRIFTLIFNVLLYSSVLQISTFFTQPIPNYFALSLAILALIKLFFVSLGLVICCNTKKFNASDPIFYVFVEQLRTKRWYARNNFLFALLARAAIILAFVLGFSFPVLAGSIMVGTQTIYTLYVVLLLRYTKVRYFVFIVLANVLVLIALICSFLGSLQTIASPQWTTFSTAFVAIVIALAALCFIVNLLEAILRKDIIYKQIRSTFYRFILCRNTDSPLQSNKFQMDSVKQKVTSFRKNLIFDQELQTNIQAIQQ